MKQDAAPSNCDVVGCDEPATGSYLHARDAQLLEFGICVSHHARLQQGERPVVVADSYDWPGLDGSPALILGS